MLQCRRLIPRHSLKKRVLSSTMPHEKKSGSGIIVLPLLGIGAGFGAAYAVEHKYVSESVAQKLSFLAPLQNLLRDNGLGYKDSSDDESIAELHRPIEQELEEKTEADTDEDIDSNSTVSVTEGDSNQSEANKTPEADLVDEVAVAEVLVDALPAEVPTEAETETETAAKTHIHEESTQTPPSPATESPPVAPSPSSSSFASDSEKLMAIRVTALDHSLETISQDMAALQAEAELALLKDLSDLDEKGLRARIVALHAELSERIRWEGLRQQQAIQAAEAQYAQQYGALLTQQRSEVMMEADRKVFDKEKELIRSHQIELEGLKYAHQKQLEAKLAEQQQALKSASAAELDAAQKALTDDLMRGHMLELAQVKESHVKKLLEVQNDVTENNREVASLRDIVMEHFDKVVVSGDVHALSAAVLLMETGLLGGKSVKTEVDALRAFAQSKGGVRRHVWHGRIECGVKWYSVI